MTQEVRAWLHDLRKHDRASAIQVGQAIGMLLEAGPDLADRSPTASPLPADQSEGTAARLRRAQRDPHPVYFDPRRNAVLLVAGDKAGKWAAWYRQAIPLAEQRYEDYLKQEDTR